MTRIQLALAWSEPTSQPPCPLDEPPVEGDFPDAAASTPLPDAAGADGADVEPLGAKDPPAAPPLQISPAKRSELGAMHTVMQLPSAVRTCPSQFVSHPQVQVDGQSESTLHGVVCGAAQLFQETSVHVVPGSQMEGIGKPGGGPASPNGSPGVGTALHGTGVTVA
jgi:hypothetical protein